MGTETNSIFFTIHYIRLHGYNKSLILLIMICLTFIYIHLIKVESIIEYKPGICDISQEIEETKCDLFCRDSSSLLFYAQIREHKNHI